MIEKCRIQRNDTIHDHGAHVMIIIDATFSCAIRGNHPILLVGDRTVLLILGGVCMDDTKESL